MTLAADFKIPHGAVLRNVRPADASTASQEEYVDASGNHDILPRTEARIFSVFPERTARVNAELRDSFRRRMCLVGMCAPTSFFLALAVWYVAL